MPEKLDTRNCVLALLQRAGLTPSAGEVDALVAAYPRAREAIASLYTAADVRDEDPAIAFDPRVSS